MTAHPALSFLGHLDPDPEATFNIEHYTDLPQGARRSAPDPLAGRYSNKSREAVRALLPSLEKVNAQGAGIFIARNQCIGDRSEKAVSRVRGIHADMDQITPQQLGALCSILHPSIIVQSSTPSRVQLYWQLSPGEYMDKADAKAINRRLVSHGADPAAIDVSRLLRLPGFQHMKYRAEGKTPVVKATYFSYTYTADQLRAAFPPVVRGDPLTKEQAGGNRGEMAVALVLTTEWSDLADRVRQLHPELWRGNWQHAPRRSGTRGYPSRSEADLALANHISFACKAAGIEESTLRGAVESIFSESALGQEGKWVSRPDYRRVTVDKAVSGILQASPPSDLQIESHGDVRNARAFAHLARGRYLYIPSRGRWLRWTDQKWRLCEKDEHIAEAKNVCGQILSVAGAVFGQDQERGKRLLQEAMAAHNLPKITAMLKLAVSEPAMAVTDSELDGDPYLLGIANGVIDLRSGQHIANEPRFHITRYCNAAWDPAARCDRWLAFLDEIFLGDTATIESVQRMLGCTLLGLHTEEVLVICYGHGSNGKSVFSNVVHHILGGYAITAPPSLLTVRRSGDAGPRNDLAALAGARYVSINELQAGDRLDEQIVKMLAGREPISARFLNQEFFEFLPNFTPWLRTNHKPIVTGEDDGIWRRLVLLHFGRAFTDDEKDPDLENTLLAERDGVLRWMAEGARLYLRDGLRISQRIRQNSIGYRNESDLLGEFLADCTSQAGNAKADQKLLYSAYRLWCEDCGVRALSKKSFTQRLAERGHAEGKSGSMRFYQGLSLNGLAAHIHRSGWTG